jgi:hypothetical protein
MLRSNLRLIAFLVPLLVLCGGCVAVGQAFDLASTALTLAASGSAAIALAAVDRRERILTGAKPPHFAGTLRGGYGNPFDVVIRGKTPLARVTADVVARGLQAKGFKVQSIALEAKADMTSAQAGLKAVGAEKLLLVEIQKWESDTYMNVGMTYRLTAKILDKTGNVIAEASVAGAKGDMDNLRGSFWNPAGYAKKAVPKAFCDQLERLLNSADIVKGLS